MLTLKEKLYKSLLFYVLRISGVSPTRRKKKKKKKHFSRERKKKKEFEIVEPSFFWDG